MPNKFVAGGAVIVVPGIVRNERDEDLEPGLQLQFQGACEQMQLTREGLAQIHGFLLESAVAVARKMVDAPSEAELSNTKVVTARSLPQLPPSRKGFRFQ